MEHILPYFVDYSRIDIIFNSSRSRVLKIFTSVVVPYDQHTAGSRGIQYFQPAKRFKILLYRIELCFLLPLWNAGKKQATQKLPPGFAFVMADPNEKAFKLQKDQQPQDLIELESNQIEAGSHIILHIDQFTQIYFFDIVVKSVDTDLIVLCIYHASLLGLKTLFVDATLSKKELKVIDCTFIRNELIDRFNVNPLIFLIVYALSGCDTCSFTRNISKRTFMQTLFDKPSDFTDLQKLTILPTSKDDVNLFLVKVYYHL